MTERGGSIYGSAGWTLLGFSIALVSPFSRCVCPNRWAANKFAEIKKQIENQAAHAEETREVWDVYSKSWVEIVKSVKWGKIV